MKNSKKRPSSQGQGLLEYLILVCLVGVASISVVSIVSQNIRARYANISNSLRGKKGTVSLEEVPSQSIEHYSFEGFEKGSHDAQP